MPPERRTLLGAWHSHNGYLQVWTELGLAGALVAAAALAFVVRALGRMPPDQFRWALAATGSAASLMLVGHSAWQGWWVAALGTLAIWSREMD